MRVDSLTLPQAPRENSRVFNPTKTFPGNAPTQANEAATTGRPDAANIAAEAAAASTSGKKDSEKLTPAGLLAAQVRFSTMNPDEMTKGQTQALESINRNIARYQELQPVPTTVET